MIVNVNKINKLLKKSIDIAVNLDHLKQETIDLFKA